MLNALKDPRFVRLLELKNESSLFRQLLELFCLAASEEGDKLTPEALAQVAVLMRQTFDYDSSTFNTFMRSGEVLGYSMAHGYQELVRPEHFLGFDGKAYLQKYAAEQSYYLGMVVLRPAVRGYGKGRTLLEMIVEDARREGYDYLCFRAKPGNVVCRSYRKMLGEPVFEQRGDFDRDFVAHPL